jgi:hypothetical protein
VTGSVSHLLVNRSKAWPRRDCNILIELLRLTFSATFLHAAVCVRGAQGAEPERGDDVIPRAKVARNQIHRTVTTAAIYTIALLKPSFPDDARSRLGNVECALQSTTSAFAGSSSDAVGATLATPSPATNYGGDDDDDYYYNYYYYHADRDDHATRVDKFRLRVLATV